VVYNYRIGTVATGQQNRYYTGDAEIIGMSWKINLPLQVELRCL
jgi:hypothetical protein